VAAALPCFTCNVAFGVVVMCIIPERFVGFVVRAPHDDGGNVMPIYRSHRREREARAGARGTFHGHGVDQDYVFSICYSSRISENTLATS
jgi:hypothetical protein